MSRAAGRNLIVLIAIVAGVGGWVLWRQVEASKPQNVVRRIAEQIADGRRSGAALKAQSGLKPDAETASRVAAYEAAQDEAVGALMAMPGLQFDAADHVAIVDADSWRVLSSPAKLQAIQLISDDFNRRTQDPDVELRTQAGKVVGVRRGGGEPRVSE